jgi:hypothetical protein
MRDIKMGVRQPPEPKLWVSGGCTITGPPSRASSLKQLTEAEE